MFFILVFEVFVVQLLIQQHIPEDYF